MRTFRFRGAGLNSNTVQTQTMECILHLDPIANLVEQQAVDCTCHTNEQCICNSCDPNATCATTAGVTTCSCNAGFSGDGNTCENVNECDTNNGDCHADATCNDLPGSHTCECNGGYTGDGITTCSDVNECDDATMNTCDATASCDNIIGGFECSGTRMTQNHPQPRYTGVTVYPEYEISIDLKLDDDAASNTVDWRQIFAFAVSGLADYNTGSRLPAVWLTPGTTQIHVCNQYDSTLHPSIMYSSSTDYACVDLEAMPTGEWFNLKVEQKFHGNQLLHKIFIDDVERYSHQNGRTSGTFENVNGYIGYDYPGDAPVYPVASGWFKNFQWTSALNQGKYKFWVNADTVLFCQHRPVSFLNNDI